MVLLLIPLPLPLLLHHELDKEEKGGEVVEEGKGHQWSCLSIAVSLVSLDHWKPTTKP